MLPKMDDRFILHNLWSSNGLGILPDLVPMHPAKIGTSKEISKTITPMISHHDWNGAFEAETIGELDVHNRNRGETPHQMKKEIYRFQMLIGSSE